MNLIELTRALKQLRLGGMAAVLETRLRQAQSEPLAPIDLISCLVSDELARRGVSLAAGRNFADLMRHSDFESFEVINSSSDVSDILSMTTELERYGSVMMAYYRPSEDSSASAHLKTLLSRRFLSQLLHHRLFAISFMDDRFMRQDPASFAIVRKAITHFGCFKCGR